MKQFYALTAMAVVLTFSSAAQFTQNFDAATSLTSGCNVVTNSDRTTVAGEVINGTGSLFSNPPVNGSGTRDYSTPYLNVINTADPLAPTADVNISFNYKLNEPLNGQAVRTIEVGLQGPSGYSSLYTITMNKDNDPLTSTSFNQTFNVTAGTYRLVLKMGGSQGNGTVRIIIDDLVASSSTLYASACNSAPLARNDVYFTNSYDQASFATVLSNDEEPNGESFSAPVVTAVSPDGTVVFNNDGTFTFTPNVGFAGTSTTFTYTVYDNGFDPMPGTASVTINFVSGSALPVRLMSFTGAVSNDMAQLNWSVGENETGHHFAIQKSTDGRSFQTSTTILNTSRTGSENYTLSDKMEASVVYYRLAIVNRNNTIAYSNILRLTSGTAGGLNIRMMQNPVQSMLSFSYESTVSSAGMYNVYNAGGAKLISAPMNISKGTTSVSIDLDNRLLTGMYILEVVNGNERSVIKFVKQ